MKHVEIETYDHVFVRDEDQPAIEVDCRIADEGRRVIIKRGLDSDEFAQVRDAVLHHTGGVIQLCPVLDLADLPK